MKSMPRVPHPTHDYDCARCKCYLKSTERRVAMDGQHAGALVKDLIAKGVNLETTTVATIAACTLGPEWKNVGAGHWCYQFEEAPR